MKHTTKILIAIAALTVMVNTTVAQNDIKLSGDFKTDQRFLVSSPGKWAWNENRLTLNIDKKIKGSSAFHSELWLRNMGLPKASSPEDLFNKGIIDPFNFEVREAYFRISGFLFENLDLKIGRQRIAWGTADKLNPTDNINPYDLEDILDFGRHRGSDALVFDYYFSNDFSLEGVFVPFFQPANMPVGVFAGALSKEPQLAPPLHLSSYNTYIHMPEYTFEESSTAALKFKGFVAGIDFSVSYLWGYDGFPSATFSRLTPIDTLGNIHITSSADFHRNHIFGIDFATSIGGIGLWGEAAAFLPEHDVVLTSDLSPLYPMSPVPVTVDTVMLKKEVYAKFIVGADYNFANGSYLNFQYLHGFVNEQGRDNLNDYFFVRYDIRFFEDRLRISPLSGGFIVSGWNDIADNHSLIYIPELSFMATDNAEIILSAAIFDGKGDNVFTNFNDYDMVICKFKYSF
jgi:hypothetical protein